ncbi:integrator complex assembly factor WDR73 [Chanos chanos]|uniref:Integrator complex assembly factor WDR73 n=1 Tax=Chanos chanos TaxID=29144 RepID=A0A6J2W235_CHACN|nr:WD repeat-containing protein 73 [Chanos chanos]
MDLSLDEEDDWFFESINAYEALHVFQLEHSTKVIEWTGEKSICVAGYGSVKNEILELILPLKLFAGNCEGLCPERDFKVDHGGFSEEPIECLKYIPGTRYVVTSGNLSSRLNIWDIGGDDSDVIKKMGFIDPVDTSARGSKMAPGLTEDPSILHGSQIKNVQLTDLTSRRVLHSVGTDSSEAVSGLQFLSPNVFLICASNGVLYVSDTRDPSTNRYTLREEKSSSEWCFALKMDQSPSDPTSCSVARLSSSGQVVISDFRDLAGIISCAKLNVKHNAHSNDSMTVTWAPAFDGAIAVSGFDGTVQIYNTNAWTKEFQVFEPIFAHCGHTMMGEEKTDNTSTVVTTHVWHPWRPKTVLSAATDGSIHVWEWIDRSTSSSS